MAHDIVLDPRTLDFVDTDDGAWEESDDSSTAVMVQLDSRLNAWWGDPTAGSRNKEILESEQATADEILDSTNRAMRALAAAGLISVTFVRLEEEDSVRGYAAFYLAWVDRASTRPADLAYSPLDRNPYERFGPEQ